MTTYADKALRCVACSADFVFSAEEQECDAAKGFTNEPRRCLACRQARRGSGRGETRGTESRAGALSGAGQGGHGDRRGGGRSFSAVCSACGGEATLPYEPVGNRPMLCGACYDRIRAPV